MILLTVYREPAGRREKREFARLQEAIEFGQKTGSDYEIYDPMTGKVIDLWKKFKSDDDIDDNSFPGDFRFEIISQSCNLRCA